MYLNSFTHEHAAVSAGCQEPSPVRGADVVSAPSRRRGNRATKPTSAPGREKRRVHGYGAVTAWVRAHRSGLSAHGSQVLTGKGLPVISVGSSIGLAPNSSRAQPSG